jgi:hypothetical protein
VSGGLADLLGELLGIGRHLARGHRPVDAHLRAEEVDQRLGVDVDGAGPGPVVLEREAVLIGPKAAVGDDRSGGLVLVAAPRRSVLGTHQAARHREVLGVDLLLAPATGSQRPGGGQDGEQRRDAEATPCHRRPDA